MPDEHTAIADKLVDSIAVALDRTEEPRQTVPTYVVKRALGVNAGPRFADRIIAEVRTEDLNRNVPPRISQELDQAHADGVRLFARGAARHPNPDGTLLLVFKDLGEDLFLKGFERLRIPKKASHAD